MITPITINHVREAPNPAIDIHLYCGRNRGRYKQLAFADLGNPHDMKDYSDAERDRVCDAYEAEIMANPDHPHWAKIRRIGQRLFEGKKVALYCHCFPKRCHCQSIKTHAIIHLARLRDPSNPFVPAR